MSPQDELKEKRQRVTGYLDAAKLHGVFLARQDNFSWMTAGGENRVGITSETGAATLFVSRERLCVIADNIEAPRLRQEELAELGIEVIDYPWHDEAARGKTIADLTGGEKAASDTRLSGTAKLRPDFDELKYSLTQPEVDRYRWLGRNCSLVVEKICAEAKQEVSEMEIAARLAYEAMKVHITPTVILVAADDRAFHYRHPLPTDKKAKDHLMVVFGGRRWGLIASLTRLVHFGEPPLELRKKHNAVCAVDAAFILNSQPAIPTGDVLEKAIATYRSSGFPDEWKLHHQGGPTGYEPRCYRVVPGDSRKLRTNQAVAWNPSIAGTKSEDTILCAEGPPEILTPCHQWPTTQYEYQGMAISRPDMLVM